ncbi:autotransporter outer membrane beta-barrel domain-containing protein [Chryseobacterium chendengshani]|uniref:hypothetical protein n=1 Tax=Chryseobacterium sp. LJ756 TaxID=2864113 RepID=UPI001C643580|nr:hypothetical protein [Chryseobacterium sp. LJ756]MBW7676537.1 hypothetical protein [Chryseobacterium sp. LJ756]
MKKLIIILSLFSINASAQSWNLTGNSGTNPNVNFLGTVDNQPLIFKINNSEKLKLSSNGRLVFYNNNFTTYENNLYVGGGNEIPSNNAGGVNWGNVAVGLGSMTGNTIGNANTAVGFNTLTSNTSGEVNIAIGINALHNSITGSRNVAVGANTLNGVVNGESNTAVGYQALRAFGNSSSLIFLGNTAVGKDALLNLNNGSNNIAVGYNIATNITNANNNILIGNNINTFSNTPEKELNIGNWIIGNNGTIGIGQFTAPLPADGIAQDGEKYKLFVKDGIKTEKVKVDIAANNGWADYVFQKDYKLMPLHELDQFINKNGHLPEVPTTEDAIKNGIELKEMNILLLKKLEELTLHVIQLDKKVRGLDEEINLLKSNTLKK